MCARARFTPLIRRLAQLHPDFDNIGSLIRSGAVLVNGTVVVKPASRVRVDAAVTIRAPNRLRGQRKLTVALHQFGVDPSGRCGLDVGAAAGGFTQALLLGDARTVYAVDVGHGQLRGSLRQDPRVRVFERTNLGHLNRELVPETIDIAVVDVSYLALAAALPQLESVQFNPTAELLALVKPTYELHLATPPDDLATIQQAVDQVSAAIDRLPWRTAGIMASPIRGVHGSREVFVHARRR